MTPDPELITVGGFLRPARSWVLPLRDDLATEPLLELDLVFERLARHEHVMIRSITRPISPRVRRQGWAVVESLRRGQVSGGHGPLRALGRGVGECLREMLTFGLTGQSYRPGARDVTRERLAEAGAAEAKVRGHLVVLEIHLLVRAADRRRARDRLRLAASVFDRCAGPFNWLKLQRPWRRRAYAHAVTAGRSWRGASFIASAEEAAALTGRPHSDLAGLHGRRVWTRRSARRGRVTHDAALFLGQTPDA
ncbi:MAG: hypothetical protein OXP73_08445 [Chloroflexota bacterium]|nr:hypothetical protein [Chloroflexota bacterium]